MSKCTCGWEMGLVPGDEGYEPDWCHHCMARMREQLRLRKLAERFAPLPERPEPKPPTHWLAYLIPALVSTGLLYEAWKHLL